MLLLNFIFTPIRLRSKALSRIGISRFISLDISKLENGSKVLVIGGFGPVLNEVSKFLEPLDMELISLDIDPAHDPDYQIDICAENISESISARFDLIVAIEVLEHTKNPQKALENVHNLLNPNGSFILSTPWITPIHDEPNDYFRFTQFALAYLLRDFTEANIYSRGNYFDSMIMLGLRGLKVKGFTAKTVAIFAYIFSFLKRSPQIQNDFNRSCIGYVAICKK